jgi:hypothetical protein
MKQKHHLGQRPTAIGSMTGVVLLVVLRVEAPPVSASSHPQEPRFSRGYFVGAVGLEPTTSTV